MKVESIWLAHMKIEQLLGICGRRKKGPGYHEDLKENGEIERRKLPRDLFRSKNFLKLSRLNIIWLEIIQINLSSIGKYQNGCYIHANRNDTTVQATPTSNLDRFPHAFFHIAWFQMLETSIWNYRGEMSVGTCSSNSLVVSGLPDFDMAADTHCGCRISR